MTTTTLTKESLLAFLEVDDIQVEDEVINKAKDNDAKSLSKIADLYYDKRAYNKAIGWYHLAVAENNAHSQWKIGRMYHYGEGVDKNYKLAMEWYLKARYNGYIRATNSVGTLYHSGQGVNQDYKTALKWYLDAANRGNEVAQYNIGLYYEKGYGVKVDKQYALEWYEKSAEKGDKDARNKIIQFNKERIYLDDRQKHHILEYIQMEKNIMEQNEKIRILELKEQKNKEEIVLLRSEKNNEIISLKEGMDRQVRILKQETANQIRLLKQETANETRILKQELEVLKLNINVSKMEKMESIVDKDQTRQLINGSSKILNEDDDPSQDICYDG